ncbi:MAG: DMT family transporter [Oscillospiraceae bacterium]|nr:DMT family transporter [Oscillospiraceae bacterium]
MSKQSAILIMLLVTLIWGGGFPATKLSLDFGVTVGIINMVRGAIFTVLVFCVFNRQIVKIKKADLKIGLLAGTANVLAFLLQTIGTQYTTLSNSAFLTTTNVIMIPFMAWVLMKRKPRARNFAAMAVCMMGTAVLAGVFHSGLSFNIGDIYTLLCAFFYGLSIVFVAMQKTETHFAVSAFMMGLTHFLGGLFYFIFAEGAHIPALEWKVAILPVLYLGIFSSFLAQSLQILSQRYVSPNTASLVFMFESVFGSIFSIAFGFEQFTPSLVLGGGLIITSLVISEVDFGGRKKIKQQN